ncbi:geranylgeranyl transferase type-1 subunit beta [Entomortierella parvispora]|uniref:Geranylgeranyl transferase type-1 subunit beta n=1 Tax=Entomortierella parvispora TaxID=205924 RepID=A0A9P3HJ89_9FUNG|nr:geranylgeranyl transferase type-1 subunit beta [Entomortierella parvispora]
MLNSKDTPPSQDGSATGETTPATATAGSTAEQKKFSREKHIQYFKRTLQMMPQPYTSMDTHRMMLGMFALSGLELLGVLEETVSEVDRKDWIEWVYSQQRVPADGETEYQDKSEALYGFGGGPFSGLRFQEASENKENRGCECGEHATLHDTAHITMTYTALMTLVLLGDDLSRVAKEPILRSLRRLQGEDGCFIPCVTDQQSDLRFVYSAAAISYLLNDWSGFDKARALKFIRNCNTYEHGFSQSPRQEAHGGTTYCAIATLGLMGGNADKDQKMIMAEHAVHQLNSEPQEPLEELLSQSGYVDKEGTRRWCIQRQATDFQEMDEHAAHQLKNEQQESLEELLSQSGYVDKEGTRRWCIQRQTTGFQGRINKPTDTCYSFWVGGSLAILGSFDLVNFEYNRGYLMETQHPSLGGFGKWPDVFPDVMHSYMGLAGLALMGEPGVRPLNPLLNYEGLVLGAVVPKTRSVVDDTSDLRVKSVSVTVVVQGVYKLEPNLPKFYTRSGDIREDVLESYSIPSNLTILGYLKYRRSEVHQLSLRDTTIALKLKMYLERKQALTYSASNPFAKGPSLEEPRPVTMALFTAKTNENMSTHDYDYTFWSIGDDESSFEALPVEISNMIESPQEDYQSFQSNLAIGASGHPSSTRMMNTISSVPTTLLVNGHEAMFRDSFDATRSLTLSVLSSEKKIRDALKEIDILKEKVDRLKPSEPSTKTPIPPPSVPVGKNEIDEDQESSIDRPPVFESSRRTSLSPTAPKTPRKIPPPRPAPRPIGSSDALTAARSPPPPPVQVIHIQPTSNNPASPPDLLY